MRGSEAEVVEDDFEVLEVTSYPSCTGLLRFCKRCGVAFDLSNCVGNGLGCGSVVELGRGWRLGDLAVPLPCLGVGGQVILPEAIRSQGDIPQCHVDAAMAEWPRGSIPRREG